MLYMLAVDDLLQYCIVYLFVDPIILKLRANLSYIQIMLYVIHHVDK